MKTRWLKEDKRLAKLPVVFSPEIFQSIENLHQRNYDNPEALTEWDNYLDGVIGYISNPVIAWDNMGKFSHKPNGETYISEGDIEVGFIIKVDNTTHQSFIYVFRINFHNENYGLRESITKIGTVIGEYSCCKNVLQGKPSKNIIVTESDIKNMVLECVCRFISEQFANVFQIGKWKCVIGGDIYEIEGKGDCQGIRMYMNMESKDKETYFLFKRQDNNKYFYATIVPAPEIGPKEVKFCSMPVAKVPREIRQDYVHPHLPS